MKSKIHKSDSVKGKSTSKLVLIDIAKKRQSKPIICVPDIYAKQARLYRLLDHYGIPHRDSRVWLKLAICLAEQYAKDFQPQKPRKKFWTPQTERLLWREHSKNKTQFPNKTDQEIFEFLATQQPWKTKCITATALQNRFCTVKKRLEK